MCLVADCVGGVLCFDALCFSGDKQDRSPEGGSTNNSTESLKVQMNMHTHKITLNSCLSILFRADCHSVLIWHKSMSAWVSESITSLSFKSFYPFSCLNVIGNFSKCFLLSSLPVFKDSFLKICHTSCYFNPYCFPSVQSFIFTQCVYYLQQYCQISSDHVYLCFLVLMVW